jgi:hypothetical protein
MQAQPATIETRLPRAVVRQMEHLNDKYAKPLGSGADPVTDPAPPAPPSATATPPVDPQPPAPAVADPRKADVAHWEQRLRTMNGILEKERREHAAEVDGLYRQVVELEEQVATLKAQPAAPSSSAVDPGKYFTPEQIERIGEEEATSIAAAADKAAQQAAQAAADKVTAMLKPEKERQQRNADREVAQKKSDFLAALAAEIPNLDEIDTSEGFHAWLAQPVNADEPDGEIRQDLLNKRSRAFNVPATAKMFKSYLATIKTPAPPVAPSSDTPPSPDGDPSPNPALKRPTPAEVKAFYTKAALNKVTDQERVEFEARLRLPRS